MLYNTVLQDRQNCDITGPYLNYLSLLIGQNEFSFKHFIQTLLILFGFVSSISAQHQHCRPVLLKKKLNIILLQQLVFIKNTNWVQGLPERMKVKIRTTPLTQANTATAFKLATKSMSNDEFSLSNKLYHLQFFTSKLQKA